MIVEPPTTFGARVGFVAALAPSRCAARSAVASARSFFASAFSSASHSTPLCSTKPLSSDAITARLSVGDSAG